MQILRQYFEGLTLGRNEVASARKKKNSILLVRACWLFICMNKSTTCLTDDVHPARTMQRKLTTKTTTSLCINIHICFTCSSFRNKIHLITFMCYHVPFVIWNASRKMSVRTNMNRSLLQTSWLTLFARYLFWWLERNLHETVCKQMQIY